MTLILLFSLFNPEIIVSTPLKCETPVSHKRHKSGIHSSILSKNKLFGEDYCEILGLSWAGEILEKEDRFSQPSISSPYRAKSILKENYYSTPGQDRFHEISLLGGSDFKYKELGSPSIFKSSIEPKPNNFFKSSIMRDSKFLNDIYTYF